MSDQIEDRFVAECRRLGHQPNQSVMREVAVVLAGSSLNAQNLIVLPGKGSLAISDLVRSLRAAMPEAFQSLDADKPSDPETTGSTLTQRYRDEIESNRRKRSLPDDWQQVRAKYDANSISGQMMREREQNWK